VVAKYQMILRVQYLPLAFKVVASNVGEDALKRGIKGKKINKGYDEGNDVLG
jgi:hypothetical protein